MLTVMLALQENTMKCPLLGSPTYLIGVSTSLKSKCRRCGNQPHSCAIIYFCIRITCYIYRGIYIFPFSSLGQCRGTTKDPIYKQSSSLPFVDGDSSIVSSSCAVDDCILCLVDCRVGRSLTCLTDGISASSSSRVPYAIAAEKYIKFITLIPLVWSI